MENNKNGIDWDYPEEYHNLSEKHKVFVNRYMNNGYNKADAARAAGYSPNHTRQAGYTVANRPDVKAVIDKMLEQIQSSYLKSVEDHVTKNQILEEVYAEVISLALREDDLTEDEYRRFKRLSEVVKTGDVLKARNSTALLMGLLDKKNDKGEDDDRIQINLNI